MKKKNKPKRKLSWNFLKKVGEKTSKVNLDTMKLLVMDENFQKLVEEIRKRFNIPNNGLKGEEKEKWWYWFRIQSDKVMNSKFYKEKHKELWNKWERKEFKNRLELDEAYREFQDNNIPGNAFHKRIKDIAIEYRLPMHFCEHIRNYVLYDKITAPSSNFVIEENFINKTITLKPFTCLSKEETRLAMIELENALKSAESGKYRYLSNFHYGFTDRVLKPYRNIDRDLKIVELSQNKGTKLDDYNDREIAAGWDYNDREIAAEIWEDDSTELNIKKQRLKIRQARHRLNKAIRKRFKKRNTLRN